MFYPAPTASRRGCAALTIAALLSTVPAAAHAADGVIPFRTGAVIMDAVDIERAADDLAALAARPGAARHLVVRLDRTPAAADRDALSAKGLTLLRPLGDGVFFAVLNERFAGGAALAGTGLVKSVAEVDPQWKLHPFLARGEFPQWAAATTGEDSDPENPAVAVYVLFHPDVALVPDGLAIAAMHGGFVRSRIESVNGLVMEMPFAMIPQLAVADAVQYIEPALPKFVELNNSNRGRVGADAAQAAPYSLDGSGVIVMVYDGGTALASHQDFGGRLTIRDGDTLSDHATHVSGTIGGDGAGSSGLYRGMAPGVSLESYGFEQEGGLQEGFLYSDPGDLEQDYNDAINVQGAVISNNSIGTNTAPNGFPCEWEGDYGVTSALIDSIVGGSLGTPMRIIWANGNERQGSAPCGSTYHTTAPPACAKNHITVGALNSNDDSMTGFSSWGPADDGRLKPDISAPGCQSNDDFDVTSCSSSGGYTGKCGTSMACPTVTGMGALIIQDYRIQYPSEPDFRNSTLKVLLAHTAEDAGNTGPDYLFGYGSVRVIPAIEQMRSGNFLEAEVDHDSVFSVLVSVGPGDTELKVTLAWDDAPGTPNVDPALVNDLDLEVFDTSNAQHYPWTLDPALPADPAVRAVADHINNIEQVVIDAPTPGVYRVDVRGFNVPVGPQTFSLTATPLLINCSSRGVVSLDKSRYPCDAAATVKIVDCDLNTDDGVVETVAAMIVSDSEPGGESLLLTETGPETSEFAVIVPMAGVDAAGTLLVGHGDIVQVTYVDADDGEGGLNVDVSSSSPVDCLPPIVMSVQVQDVEARSAKVAILTDEPVQAVVRYGSSCGALTGSAGSAQFRTDHLINLSQLTENSIYYYEVELTDQAGNSIVDDNSGGCYSFATPDVPDWFTEEFGGDNDLDGYSVTFTPGHPVDFYSACEELITALPVTPSGTTISLSDDGSSEVSIGVGFTVSLYGTDWSSFFVNANGNITFGASDGDYTESLNDHYSQPRISAIFDDFNPSAGGTVMYRQLADRMVVTWENVPEYSTSNSNTFQIEMFFDGVLRVSWLGLDVSDGLTGLSDGNGVPPDFLESDMTNPGGCGVPDIPGDANGDGIVDVNDLNEIIIAWGACPPDPDPCPADLNGDGMVDVNDLVMVITFWSPGAQTDTPGSRPVARPAVAAGNGATDATTTPSEAATETGAPGVAEFVNAGWLAPADHGGVFTTDGGYRQTPAGTLAIEVAGPRPVDDHDLLASRGHARLDGTLSVQFVDGFEPRDGDRFPVVVGRGIIGQFTDVEVTPQTVDAHVAYGDTSVQVIVGADDAAASVAAVIAVDDLDGDGVVAIDDVFALLRAWGPQRRSPADLNDDGFVDGEDLAALVRELP